MAQPSPLDTVHLSQLVERLEQLVEKLDSSSDPIERTSEVTEQPTSDSRPAPKNGCSKAIRATRPPLPDPRLIRRILRERQLRARYFNSEFFSDPVWDMLLDLTAAHEEHRRVSVTSLCIASGVPPTTALRWISILLATGLLKRTQDMTDRRRAFISLTDTALAAMAKYFAEVREM